MALLARPSFFHIISFDKTNSRFLMFEITSTTAVQARSHRYQNFRVVVITVNFLSSVSRPHTTLGPSASGIFEGSAILELVFPLIRARVLPIKISRQSTTKLGCSFSVCVESGLFSRHEDLQETQKFKSTGIHAVLPSLTARCGSPAVFYLLLCTFERSTTYWMIKPKL